jgi:hypothetical protein
MPRKIYRETFDHGPAGWYGWVNNAEGMKALPWRKGRMTTRSPWWIDYNHAPPGAGYLHMLFCLCTRGPFGDQMKEMAGKNGFVAGGYPLDFRNARMTVRVRGELEARGAQMRLLVQAKIGDIVSSWLLAKPFPVGRTWKEQSAVLTNDPKKWTPLGARYDRLDYYNVLPLDEVLRNVNVNILFVLFPLDVRPMGPIPGHPHRLRAGKDYPVWTSRLPDGYIELDTVKLEFKVKGSAE